MYNESVLYHTGCTSNKLVQEFNLIAQVIYLCS